MPTVDELKFKLKNALTPLYGEREAAAMARLVLHSLKGWTATQLIIHEADRASQWLIDQVNTVTIRLLNHEPIQYVLGEAYFHGMHLKVGPGVLIPRPETEELVDIVAAQWGQTPDLRLLDIGCGSGAIAIALARVLRFPQVTAIDISPEAIAVSLENAASLKARIKVEKHDIFSWSPDPDSFDIIVSNPPYVAEHERADMEPQVKDHEPALALFVPDENPLLYYSRIAEVARTALAPAGALYFEINPLYATDLAALLAKEGFIDIALQKDAWGKTRFASARKEARP